MSYQERALSIIDRLTDSKIINIRERGILRRAILLTKRPKGEWIPQTSYDGFTYWKCSECGMRNDFAVTKFCFHCGADMRKEK